jgi:hypothetical protein
MTRKRAGGRFISGNNGAVASALLAAACSGRGPQSPPPQAATSTPLLAPAVLEDHSDPVAGRSEADSGVLALPGGPEAGDGGASPPPPRTWVKVPGGAIVRSRTHGDDHIEPDNATRAELAKARRRASGTFRLCVDEGGAVVLARAVIETGFPAYDEKILREVRAWKFRPYVIDGEPSGVCSEVNVSSPSTKTARGR